MGPLKAVVMQGRRVRSRTLDTLLGIDSITIPPFERRPGTFPDSVHYEPPDYVLLRHALRRVRLAPSDVFFEIGCGLGRVVCEVARQRVERVIGIELCAELARVAERNAVTVRRRQAAIEIRVGDAAEADYDGGTVYFMFNPFGAATMSAVMDRIRESVERSPRHVRVVYMNPLHSDVLRRQPWLACRDEFRLRGFRSATHVFESL
ncbi:MAG: class I SAM-dependent methyltransferase [Phycisphaerales bacterium JB041]